MSSYLGLDIGSNSVGSAWIDYKEGVLATGTSIFPAGVDESDEKRGEPKNAKRRMTRRTRITLARRAARKRRLRQALISAGLLPPDSEGFKTLLEQDDPWSLRRKGLDNPLRPYQFGRVILHLAQRRGAQGLRATEVEDGTDAEGDKEEGKVKTSIIAVRTAMRQKNAHTFGELMAILREERVSLIKSPDRRSEGHGVGPREYRGAIRNKGANYEHCADRAMIRDEFAKLWNEQKRQGGPLAEKLTDDLRLILDDEMGDSDWKQKGLLFGQRRASWDVGTLGRCVLEPTERCVPHADMYASRYLVVETVNNLKIIERGKEARSLTPEERDKIKKYLSGPLGIIGNGKLKGQPKRSVSISDLRRQMDWGLASKTSQFRFNVESDEDRDINTDWFSREIIHGAITPGNWERLGENARDRVNRAILKYDPGEEEDERKMKAVTSWAKLTEAQADAVINAWKRRPKPDSKRLNMSRRAARNLLALMDGPEPWPDLNRPGETRWLTPIEARKSIAADKNFRDVTTGRVLDETARIRYATGAKGATARDRHYMKRHPLRRNGQLIFGPDGCLLPEPPPAPMISNPVVRKAIHEVRRHLIEYMIQFGRKPDQIHVELAREAKMGKKDADALLFRNRLRNRIRNDIVNEFGLSSYSSTQQHEAVRRVVLAMQQKCVCAICGKTMIDGNCEGISLRTAAEGRGCEVAHIIPRASGGMNGFANTMLAHDKCNRNMGRRTPRQFWESALSGGYEEGITWIEKMYRGIERPKISAVKEATGQSLWACYFTRRDDLAKIAQFKKDVKDIQGMTARQEAATKYATRQVMAYLADALFDGKGLPERGGDRRIYATDGMWTSRLRREWGLFFDPHSSKAKGLSGEEHHVRKEKNRGDHRHHAIDAVLVAYCSQSVRNVWDAREKRADVDGINTADEAALETYRRLHPLDPPAPFRTTDEFRHAVARSIFGDGEIERPLCHRPVKRKLIGPLHKATQYGPVIDTWKHNGTINRELVEGRVTVRQAILGETPGDFLKVSHLRLPRLETDDEAIRRLARRYRIGKQQLTAPQAITFAKKLVKTKAFTRKFVDPKPEKGGLVRDIGQRRLLRHLLEQRGLNPENYTQKELKQSIDLHGPLKNDADIPIHKVTLLWSNSDPVTILRDEYDHATSNRRKLDRADFPYTLRLYDGQNNHHIEIRSVNKLNGKQVWSGVVVTGFEVAQRKLARLRAFKRAGIPKSSVLRSLPIAERAKFKHSLRDAEQAHPLVDRSDNPDLGGNFVMSLCEGEMLFMKHKETGEIGYFVVAKLDKPQSIFLVPHWDARSATERKDSEGKKVPDSKREQFPVTPMDLKKLAPPGQPHALKVRVSPLGQVKVLNRD